MPISKGGLHSWDNVRLAHRICNRRKGNHMPPWVAYGLYNPCYWQRVSISNSELKLN